MEWLEPFPLPGVAVLILAALLASTFAGYRACRWLRTRRGMTAPENHDHLLSAVLGLLALLLGFTFSLALNRYEARRDLVVQEANAIGTTWQLAQVLNDGDRAAMTGLLRDYLQARLAWSETADEDDAARTAALQRQLWSATSHVVRTDANPALSRALMDAMNQSFGMASARLAARSAHVPNHVFDILLLCAVLSTAMLGYASAAKGSPHRAATAMMPVLLTLALVLILDVDRPRSGGIQVSQQPLIDLQQSWR